MDYIVEITPQPALRPSPDYKNRRLINKPKYRKYKNTLSSLFRGRRQVYDGRKIEGINLPEGNYWAVKIIFYFPYPKSTPKYKRIEGARHKVKPDLDNLEKAFLDSLKQANIIKDDNGISRIHSDKLYTIQPYGRIEFKIK